MSGSNSHLRQPMRLKKGSESENRKIEHKKWVSQTAMRCIFASTFEVKLHQTMRLQEFKESEFYRSKSGVELENFK